MHTAANPSSFVKMAIFDMDNTLLHRSFIHTAAAKLGFTATLERIIAEKHPAVVRTQLIAQLLKGRTQEELVDVVRSIAIVGDAATVIGSLMEKGYVCGIISDSYTCITGYVKEQLGMHFSCANVLEFAGGKATGVVSIPANFLRADDSDCLHDYCKCNMMHHMRSHYAISLENTLAIGDGVNDICMIQQAGTGIAFNATHHKVNEAADHIVDERSFMPVLGLA